MKKLMTMIGAAATALGLFAADPVPDTGTSFEGVTAPAKLNENQTAGDLNAGTSLWGGTISDDNVITAYGTETPYQYPTGHKATAWGDATTTVNYLAIKTGANEIERYVNAGQSYDIAANGAIFFDSLVKFTAFDEAQDVVSGAKFAAWIEQLTDDGDVTLYVQAGNNKYSCGTKTTLLDQWAHVTVKAFIIDDANENIGFRFFINGNPVEAADDIDYTGFTLSAGAQYFADQNQLFPYGEISTLEGAAFKGTGSIDDVLWTQTVPGFVTEAVTFDIKKGEHVESFTINGVPYTSDVKLGFAPGTTEVQADVVYATGYYGTTPWTITADSLTIGADAKKLLATVTVDETETKCATVADIMAALVDGAVVTLNDTVTDTLNFAVAGAITLDLNGQTITAAAESPAITAAVGTSLTIVDNAETKGTVNGGVVADTDEETGAPLATISITADATFNGDALTVASISAGKFKKDLNESRQGVCLLTKVGHDGYEWVAENDYWVLKEAAVEVDFTVTPGANASGYTVKIDGKTVEEVPTKLTEGQNYEVTFKADDGYKFADDETGVRSGKAEKTAITVQGPDAALIVAEIDDAKFTSLQAAADAAQDGETIVLAADYTGNGTLMEFNLSTPTKRDVTLDINGKKVAKNDSDSAYAFSVYGEGTLTVIDSVTDSQGYLGKDDVNGSCFLVGGCGDEYKGQGGRPAVATAGHLVWNSGKAYCKSSNVIKIEYGTLEVNGGTIDGNQPAESKTTVAIKASVAASSGGSTATIKGGLILGSVEQSGNGAKVEIPAKVGDPEALNQAKFTADYTSFIVPTSGYEMKKGEDEYWKVQEATAADPTKIDPATIPAGTKVSAIFTAVPADLANADAATFAAWCQNAAIAGGASVGTAGADAKLNAYLLNCANTDAAIAAAKEEFKVTISFDAEGKPVVTTLPADKAYNELQMLGATTLVGDNIWHAMKDGDLFFKAELKLAE